MKYSHTYFKLRFWILLIASLAGSTLGFTGHTKQDPPFLSEGKQWVDSVMNTLTPRERIAQLIHIAAYSNRSKGFEDSLLTLVEEFQVGGLIFFQGGPVRQAQLVNRYQGVSKVPLLISMDAEWGLGMRLDSTISFPYQMTLGAAQDDLLIREMGREIGRQFRRLGVHLNFAPVADVNNNPNNPVINYRSFGEDTKAVTEKSLSYMRGLQEEGILVSAKHFPGHGDTETDSHYDLPQLPHSRERLKTVELAPFRAMIEAGASGVMVAHMNIPSLDSTENLPSTLSKPIVTGLLQDEMGFQGLIMTDALNMQGVTKYYQPGEVDVKALVAGNDMLLFSQDVSKALEMIEDAIKQGRLSQKDIDRKCRKVLAAKYWVGLHDYKPVEVYHLVQDLNTPQAQVLHRRLIESSLTVIKNDDVLPVKRLDTLTIASLSIGADKISRFQHTLDLYAQVDHFLLPKEASQEQTQQMGALLKDYDLIIVALHQVYRRPGNSPGFNEHTYQLIDQLMNDNTLLVSFRNPYTLGEVSMADQAGVIICAYQDQPLIQDLSAQLIFGGIGASGRLPVTVNSAFGFGQGLDIQGGKRLKYTIPEEVGINTQYLHRRVDSVVQVGLDSMAYPGAQVLAAKDGKVFMHRVYGHHTYQDLREVRKDDIYDLASVTKITGPLPALMRLYGEGKLQLDQPFSYYWEDFKGTDKEEMTVREVLAHYAQLKSWIPYWESTKRKSGKFKRRFLRSDSSRRFPIRLTDNLYLKHNYRDKQIYKAIRKSPLEKEKKYLYSGLSFYLYPRIIEDLTGINYEDYVRQEFYLRLGANTLTYNPMRFYDIDRIVPTENDGFFRMEQLHGKVHDEGAAMMQGVSGNAGLFSTANDLAKIMQMYLQGGTYGGERYIQQEAVSEFTKCQYCAEGNRRGLGFDKPVLENKMDGSTAWDASGSSYGHSGYTGTFTWVDPENGLLYIFFSNRVYPTRDNPKLYRLSIRPAIHQVLYDALRHGVTTSSN